MAKTITARTRKTRKAKAAAQPAAKTETKQATVLKLLRRQDGASIQEITDATGCSRTRRGRS